jgi:hypothetical protein
MTSPSEVAPNRRGAGGGESSRSRSDDAVDDRGRRRSCGEDLERCIPAGGASGGGMDQSVAVRAEAGGATMAAAEGAVGWGREQAVVAAAPSGRDGVVAFAGGEEWGRRARAKRPPIAGSALREARAAAASAAADGAEAAGTRTGAASLPRRAPGSCTDGGALARGQGMAAATPATTAPDIGMAGERTARGLRIWPEHRRRRPVPGDQGVGAPVPAAAMVALLLVRKNRLFFLLMSTFRFATSFRSEF